jgi:hypothetical protein
MTITALADIAEIPAGGAGNSIFVTINDLGNDKVAVDVRRWYVGDDEEWHPTSKGISISTLHLDAIIEALQEARSNDFVAAKIDAPAPTKVKGAVKKVRGVKTPATRR